MNKLAMGLAAAAMLAGLATASLPADDAPDEKQKGATSAPPTAESAFAELRKAAAAHDDAALAKALPSSLVKEWPDEAKEDGKAWRAALAARIADGEVVGVRESGDSAIARWKTGAAASVWELRLRREGGRWAASSPWVYCVGGGDLAKANGPRRPAHVKLKMRTTNDAYGPSAFSFAHVTQDPKECLNRMDVWFCRCGKLHASGGAMISVLKAKSLDEPAGLQTGGDWMDEVVPKDGTVYVVHVNHARRTDFQVVLLVKSLTATALEFDWRLVAAGKNAPASTRAPQPIIGDAGADGTDGICGLPGK